MVVMMPRVVHGRAARLARARTQSFLLLLSCCCAMLWALCVTPAAAAAEATVVQHHPAGPGRRLLANTWGVPTPPIPSYPCRTTLPDTTGYASRGEGLSCTNTALAA
jgi:hypothetical protein